MTASQAGGQISIHLHMEPPGKYCKVPQQSYHNSVQLGQSLPHKRVGDQVVRQRDKVEVSLRLLIRNCIAVPSGQSVVNNLMAKHIT